MKILCIKLHKARSRNWIVSSVNTYPEDKFSFYIDYFYNGNVKTQRINGNYRMNFPGSTREVLSGFQYDNSNRLLGVYNFPKFYSPLENFSYDKDGNLQTLTRDYSGDNFSYQYYSGTSKLRSIDGGGKESSSTIYYYFKDHLGNIRAVMDGTSGTITQAQDYDAWGDICRTYSTTDTTVNKFTGKERDIETGYDYFGARYYDSRIGRWLQIEPLYDKYLQYSPYQYGLLNPMKLVDADGNDVYITGQDAINAVKLINEITNDNFIISIDPETGKLDYYGEAKSEQEKLLLKAITDKNINVNLYTTDGNYIDNEPFAVGLYYGSKKMDNKIESTQYINLAHAKVWEDAGGSKRGGSVIHEILESYVGAILQPGEYKYNEANYLEAHEKILKLESPKEFYPQIFHDFKHVNINNIIYKIHIKSYLYNKNKNKTYLLFENEEAKKYKYY